MIANEFRPDEQQPLLQFLHDHRTLIVSDVLKGRGKFFAEWFLLILHCDQTEEWALMSINYVINFFGNGEISITPPSSFRIGRITSQRKSGEAGRPTANMPQFKINPALLIAEEA